MVYPSAIRPTIVATGIRVPRTQGAPPMMRWSAMIRSSNMLQVYAVNVVPARLSCRSGPPAPHSSARTLPIRVSLAVAQVAGVRRECTGCMKKPGLIYVSAVQARFFGGAKGVWVHNIGDG